MKTIKKNDYVLKKSLRKKGSVGDVIKVAPGFGRYLESQGIAERLNAEMIKTLEEKKQQWKLHELEHEKIAINLIDKIKNMQITIKKRVAQGEKLYDSVRPENVVAAFHTQGINLENHNIKMNHQIKKTGKHKIIVHAYGNYETELEIDVVSDADIF